MPSTLNRFGSVTAMRSSMTASVLKTVALMSGGLSMMQNMYSSSTSWSASFKMLSCRLPVSRSTARLAATSDGSAGMTSMPS